MRKYCCYPQKNIKVNYFRNNQDNEILKKNYFMEDMKNICQNNNITCTICLNNINIENLGITDCGHIFCYSCIFKSISINPKCPKCRNDINKEQIYLYDIDDIDDINDFTNNCSINSCQKDNCSIKCNNKCNNKCKKNKGIERSRNIMIENIKRSRSNKYRYKLELV